MVNAPCMHLTLLSINIVHWTHIAPIWLLCYGVIKGSHIQQYIIREREYVLMGIHA
jgi:hypothetical protein